jgi:hypothetical protein
MLGFALNSKRLKDKLMDTTALIAEVRSAQPAAPARPNAPLQPPSRPSLPQLTWWPGPRR